MKRGSLLLAVVATALLALPAAAAAHPLPGAAQAHRAPAGALGPVRAATRLSPSFGLTGTGVLSVTVQDSHGAGLSGVPVDWSVAGGGGSGKTNASGLVQLRNVPASGGQGEIDVDGHAYFYDITGMTWPAAGNSYLLEPARQALTITRLAGSTWKTAYVNVYTSDTDGNKLSETDFTGTAGTVSGTANVLAGAMTGAVVYFYSDEGVELTTSGLTAVAGADTATALTCDEATDGRYIGFLDWSSGKPGSKDRLHLGGYPAGWVNDLSGYNADTGRPSSLASTWTSTGAQGSRVITVPTSVKPGQTYVVDVQHDGGLLDLQEAYQVCSLNASSAAIHKGQTVRLSGVVPAVGHSKRLVVYKRTSSAGQPSVAGGAARVKGWTRAGYVTASGKGAYSKSFKPTRTTSYVVWYPKDVVGGELVHWAAYTSVRKVTVR
jgi:hypothetical protein